MSFGLQLRWLLSSTPVTYFSKLLEMKLLAALLQPEIQMGMSVQGAKNVQQWLSGLKAIKAVSDGLTKFAGIVEVGAGNVN